MTNGTLLTSIENAFTAFFLGTTLTHHPIPWLTVTLTTLITDACYPKSLVRSDRLTYTRLTLMYISLTF